MQRNSRSQKLPGVHSATVATAVAAALVSCGGLHFDSPRERLEVSAPATWQAASAGRDGKISSGWLREFSDAGDWAKGPQGQSQIKPGGRFPQDDSYTFLDLG